MNSDSTMNLVRQLLTMVFAMLTAAVPALATSANFSVLQTAIMSAIPALCTIGSVVWSAYAHWNMKKVPEKSTAIDIGPHPVGSTVAVAPAGATPKLATVVG